MGELAGGDSSSGAGDIDGQRVHLDFLLVCLWLLLQLWQAPRAEREACDGNAYGDEGVRRGGGCIEEARDMSCSPSGTERSLLDSQAERVAGHL